MATKSDIRGCFSQLKSLVRLQQRFANTLAEGKMQEKTGVDKGSNLFGVTGQHDMSKWKKMDSRNFGITTSMLSQSSWIALKVLRNEGFEAYLVGGCVRDLILKRTPKDFDVITTADLKQIKSVFHHAYIVGRRFPICQVNLKGSVIEVSSFKKVAGREKEKADSPKMPKGCSNLDYVRWKDCIRRDFTVNSLFYDPFANKIYDYANAIMDLKLSKLQTLIPAHMSFKEDCARILRGLRIAGRLGLSLSEETETAIHELSSSITSLNKSRLMMEMNYMLSYGASEPSVSLLQRFKLLQIMLPFHDAYLSKHSGDPASPSSLMLMKLFSSLDKVVTCGEPCDSLLWIGLLAFHMALVTNPQEALVVWTFSSLLYHGNWNESLKSARLRAFDRVDFKPEILKTFSHLSDDELALKVSEFASTVQDSIRILTDSDSLLNAMAAYPSSPCSGMVFVPKRFITEGARLFDFLAHDIQSATCTREEYKINSLLLGKGNIFEVRFVLGKIIMDTLSGGVVTDDSSATVNKRSSLSLSDAETTKEPVKKQKLAEKLVPSSKKMDKENKGVEEQSEMDIEPSKKQKLVEKVQRKVKKERKVKEKLASSPKTKPDQNEASKEPVTVKERQTASRLSGIFKEPVAVKERQSVGRLAGLFK